LTAIHSNNSIDKGKRVTRNNKLDVLRQNHVTITVKADKENSQV
jgi:hypothetical protein